MAFPAVPKASKGQINAAGALLASDEASIGAAEQARRLLSDWRACHLLPLDACAADLLKRLTALSIAPITAQRLKRLPRIVGKLRQFGDMKVARMQDIAGIRAIVHSSEDVRRLVDSFVSSPPEILNLGRQYDYLTQPKPTGYRSIHLVFQYKGSLPSDYDGLSVELQVRTELQHLWASAVEATGMWTGQRLKYDQGDPDWARFFLLIAEVLARTEGLPASAGFSGFTNNDLCSELADLEEELNAFYTLRSHADRLEVIEVGLGTPVIHDKSYQLLSLDIRGHRLTIRDFGGDAQAEASEAYAEAEQQATFSEEGVGPLLVCVDAQEHLRDAYRSFYLDTVPFADLVDRILRTNRI